VKKESKFDFEIQGF